MPNDDPITGGKSLKVARNWPVIVCAGTNNHILSPYHLVYKADFHETSKGSALKFITNGQDGVFRNPSLIDRHLYYLAFFQANHNLVN